MGFIEQLINGLNLGSIYALMALGYTMVYGIAKMLNFAHGDIIMVGAYTLSLVMTNLGMPPVVAILASVIVCSVLGVTIEKIAYKPLRNASPLTVLITAIGVSYFLQSVALLIFGSNKRKVDSAITMSGIKIGGLELTGESIVTLGITILIMIGLTLFIKKTKIGKAMLAVSEDKGAAQLMGINVNQTISITFAIGSALAAVAGVLFVSSYGFVGPYTGSLPGIKAFVAAVLGGIGSIPGAMLGGILLGIIESLSKAYISTNLSDAIVFAVLIIVLLVKPSGLLGKIRMDKV
ncbi:MAG: branched-chain amino acid ABC transporter permease [Candidatus Cellulosilyticum pullistercoris]|uniref:Branched-chain amino acid ABC transporter permease n=1 Tax=Candidatus Cellulosilyticum pullistercoris TaxID=2838521 RepID=A0A9E2KBG9_9FIRM|nr:branched-chain amino acid ABC transporter permease [Candidatus Cellulosilyticum pullistercoris]